jgi:CubicO group peptidase (beta-lactamase class C family)
MDVKNSFVRRSLARIAILLTLAAGLGASAPAISQSFPPDHRIDNIFAEWDRTDSPGCSVAIARDGKVIYARGYGMADLDHGISNRPGTVFHAASLAKQITAMSILLLIQQHPTQISLDDEVHVHIPELAGVAEQFTIRQMLQHVSGIRDHWVLATLAGWRVSYDTVTTNDVIDMVKRMKTLNHPPGEKFVYGSTGYTLAAKIVEKISGKMFAEFAREHIFRPLGMSDTKFTPRHGEIVWNRAYGYRGIEKPYEQGPFEMRMPGYDVIGPTNLVTTVGDLIRWQNNLDHPKPMVGGPSAIAEMLKLAELSGGRKIGYGLGLYVGKYRGLAIVEHDGSDAGFRSHLISFPAQRFAVACLCNQWLTEKDWPGELVRKIAELFVNFAEPAPAPFPTAPFISTCPPADATPAPLMAYEGRYWSDEVNATYDIAVSASGSSLQLTRPKYPAKDLTLTSTANQFSTEDLGDSYSGVLRGEVRLTFSKSGSGQIDGFCMQGRRLENLRFTKQKP